jgi:2-polyprenyl-3-methyl-5-hydroxy-6-metoxy-1,4-benzoquinol methylase
MGQSRSKLSPKRLGYIVLILTIWKYSQGHGTLERCSYGPGTSPMVEPKIRFDDGAAYEQMMGVWSRLAGEIFLDWLVPPSGLRWIDIGCGNGAFTELLVERCAPSEVEGVDPSEGSAPCKVSHGRRHGSSLRRPQFRCRRDGVGACVRSQSGEGD